MRKPSARSSGTSTSCVCMRRCSRVTRSRFSPVRPGSTISCSWTRPTRCTRSSNHSLRDTCRPCSSTTRSSSSKRTPACSRRCRSRNVRLGSTVRRGARCTDYHRDRAWVLRPRHERPHRRDHARRGHLRPRRRRRRRQPAPQAADVLDRGARRLPARGARAARQRRGRRLPRARRRVRAQVGREGDRERASRALGLRVGVPDEPAQPASCARDRDRVRDGVAAGELRVVERREGDRRVRRRRVGARARAGRTAVQGAVPERPAGHAGEPGRVSERDVTLRDGRTLHVYDHGDPDGNVVVEHHGTPGSGLLYPPDVELARERGLRILSYDRAGYGGSTANPGRVVSDIGNDITDLLDALGVDRFASLGGSGGAPHSLALGALMPERCAAVGAIASPTPWQAEGIDWLDGQGEQNVEEWEAALRGPQALHEHLEPLAAELREASAEDLRDLIVTLLPPVDREVLTGDRAAHAKANFDRAIENGVVGWRDDDLAFTKPWGFELVDVGVPSLLWQGVQDKMVPVAHGRWLAERIPGVEAHISEPDGHLSITVGRLGEIYDWLGERLR